MYEEQEKDSMDTVEKSVKAAKAIQNATHKGTLFSMIQCGGNPYGMMVTIWQNRSIIKKIAAVFIALPILFLLMLPSVIFDDITANPEIPILNHDATVLQNIKSAELEIWSILKQSHDAVIIEIDAEIANLSENEKGVVIDEYAAMNSFQSGLLLSQYSISKEYTEINIADFILTVSAFQEQLFSYTVSYSERTNEEGEVSIVYEYTVTYAGNDFFVDTIFQLNEEREQIAAYYAENLMTYLYGSQYQSNAGASVSAEVLRYEEWIRKYAEQYGISEYFHLICAIMMAESGGRVADVMQSSECPYNTKYPNKPNAIDDPEYSIDCGVHYLADCLQSAGALSPADTGKISLALQGYNFGNGYISWALQNYGGYTEANALEFSEMMKKKMGWNTYGNPRYVQDVLKYIVPVGNGKWGSPFVGKNWLTAVTSEFGNRIDPINGQAGAYHTGLDIAYPTGTPINAVGDGVVLVAAETNNGYGKHIEIDHGNGVITLYGHCNALFVAEGQRVVKGQVIGEVGTTGRVTGPHLHIEFIVNGVKENPRDFIEV